MGLNGPRKLHARIPALTSAQDIFKLPDSESLADLECSQPHSVLYFKNKQPKWNNRISSYALNFGGRVKMASIKNFILEDPADPTVNLIVT
jgi:hypothetical protein